MNIEQPAELIEYLRQTSRISPDEEPSLTILAGGVSNRTVLVQRVNNPAFVLKQALPRLRVEADWFSDPARSQREALGAAWLERLAPAGSIPRLVFEDASNHLLAMEAVPQPHENWKERLLAGDLDRQHIRKFGELLGAIHRRSHERQSELARIFEDRRFFETLRLEPYYRFAAKRNPGAAAFYETLIAETLSTREALVHGDYSPKNILVTANGLVLLDYEVIHWGDPAFDLGFALTHLLSKGHHLGSMRAAFLAGSILFWETYCEVLGRDQAAPTLEHRAARHTLACLLARVDGRSPLEYLSPAERNRQRAVVTELMGRPPGTVTKLVRRFEAGLAAAGSSH